MKKMNVYEAPKAEVIEMNLNATVFASSNTGEIGGDGVNYGGSWNK